MAWWSFFKIFDLAFQPDPHSAKTNKDFTGAGVSQPDAVPDIRAMADGTGGRGSVRLRDTNEIVDLSTVTNRIHRTKEYDRLRNMPEIEMAMTVIADEACFAGSTKIMTPAYEGGYRTLEWLATNKANERFLVYSWNFEKQDYTLAWGYAPRLVKRAKTVRVVLDDGTSFICTADHRILLRDETWCEAGQLRTDMRLMPFYRINPNPELTQSKMNQFPRIFTHLKGWITERQFVDEWRTGKPVAEMEEVNKICRMVVDGLTTRQIRSLTGRDLKTIKSILQRGGFSNKELKLLARKQDYRRVLCVFEHEEMDVYDLSVEKHENFCTEWGVAHNCQKDENGRVFQVNVKNAEVKKELEFLCFHKKMLNMDQKWCYNRMKNTCINGDDFWELVIDLENPKKGVYKLEVRPPESMFRIETTKGRLLEFQQSKEGPDYDAIAKTDVRDATESELEQCKAVRFTPEQIIHVKIGDDRKTFYPYGVSLIEPARGPAHSLRMMEESMLVYRLSRAPERRVFYIDTMQLPPAKAEALVERMKDMLKKKKVPRQGNPGASSVDERYHAPPADEDIWIPTPRNSNTRVETLPGAQNLGEVDDTVYFRNKLFVALNFPKNYFNTDDVSQTRVSLSSIDVKFARMIERLQSHFEDAIWELCDRHLKLRGFPEEAYEDLVVKMTPPSDWRELTRMEVVNNRIGNAGQVKGAQIMALFDIHTKIMKYPEDETKLMIARLKIEQIEQLKMQIISQNPTLAGVGLPSDDEEKVSTDPADQNPMLGGTPDAGGPPGMDGMEGMPPDQGQGMGGAAPPAPGGSFPKQGGGIPIPEPEEEDIQKYGLYIKDFGSEMDDEEQDASES
jgi:hypothetical protein